MPLHAPSLTSVSPWDWGTVAAVPLVIDGPACVPSLNPNGQPPSVTFDGTPTCFSNGCPTGQPQAVPIVLVVACPLCAPTWDPAGTPTARPPANAWGLAHVGSGCHLVCGGRSKLTTDIRLACTGACACGPGGGFPSFAPLAPCAESAHTPISLIHGSWYCCRHGKFQPSASATHLSRAYAQINPPRWSKRTSARMDVMPYLAINDDVCDSIPTSFFASCHIDNHGMCCQ